MGVEQDMSIDLAQAKTRSLRSGRYTITTDGTYYTIYVSILTT